MNLLINRKKLELLLEKNKEKIGHDNIQGIETLFSGITFGISTIFASYTSIGIFSDFLIKQICVILSVGFSLWGIYMITKSLKTKYGPTELLNDIENLNEITHPFSIVAIKDTFNKFPNNFLLYYDTRWDCKFFIYYRTQATSNEVNEENICTRLSNELKIKKDRISVEYRSVKIQRKFSVSDQKYKCYEHQVYYVKIPFNSTIKNRDFIIDGKHYYWMSIAEMEQDPNIIEKNLDVVNLISESIP